MLQTLRIRKFVLIDEVELNFEPGFNVITGETGTGKSIILEAISLILGSRANTDLIRNGEEEASVEALFDISNHETLQTKARQKGLVAEDHRLEELLIKRIINRNGRGRVFINGEISTLSQLIDISENLVDLCSQHEHQSLAKPPYQMALLDKYAGLTNLTKEISEIHTALKSKKDELLFFSNNNQDVEKQKDYLVFQIGELSQMALTATEEQELIRERKLLLAAEQLKQTSQEAICTLTGDMINSADEATSIKILLAGVLKKINKFVNLDDRLKPVQDSLTRAQLEIEESSLTLEKYLNTLDCNTERLNKIENCLTLLAQLKRKYSKDGSDLLLIKSDLEKQLQQLEQRSVKIMKLEQEVNQLKTLYLSKAKELSKKRKAAQKILEDSIQEELNELRMGGTIFKISLLQNLNEESWGPSGVDSIEFLFAPNKGEGLNSLGKMASGGELSRMLLAIRRVVSDQGGICVYLFDEIDTGIGGETAAIVGKKIKSVAKCNQVICITHLAQIASFANTHFSVSKVTQNGRTKSKVRKISSYSEKIEEIARMAGGNQVGPRSRDYAKELLAMSLKV